jgi:hypothetical protein
VTAIAWTDGGRALLSLGADHTIRLWETATGKLLRRASASSGAGVDRNYGPHAKAAFSPDGAALAVVDPDGGIVLMDASTGKERNSLGVSPGKANSVRFTPDGKNLLIGTTESYFHLWDMKEGSEARPWQVRDGQLAPFNNFFLQADSALTPGQDTLVACREDGELVLIDTASERVVRTIPTRFWGDTRTEISPDGHTLVWGGSRRDTRILLCELASGKSRLTLEPRRPDRTVSLTFSADGRKLLSGFEDGTALIWDVADRSAGEGSDSLTPEKLRSAWGDLSSADAAKAYRSVRLLANNPKESVPFLRKALAPATPVDEKLVAKLVNELCGGVSEQRRKELVTQLDELGDATLPEIDKADRGFPDPQVRSDLRQLMAWHRRELLELSPARLRELRAIEVLELASTLEAQRVIETIAQGEKSASRTRMAKAALGRLQSRSP